MEDSRLLIGWLATWVVVLPMFVSGVGFFWMIAGGVVMGWGVAIATNYRGAADAMPKGFRLGPLEQHVSRGAMRRMFGFFGLWGALLLVAGITRSI
jgi:hypothetical protein